MSLLWPWALAGLVALPALLAIYLLRQRSRSLPVSSLLLWRAHVPDKQRGRRLDRLRGRWLMALEALALLLLVWAAVGPAEERATDRRPLVVVLDASFSMGATVDEGGAEGRGGETVWERARRALLDELESGGGRHLAVSLVEAGPEPRQLARGIAPDEVARRLADWKPRTSAADLERALERAREIGGPHARLLVLGDRPPPEKPKDPRLEWWAFGRSRDNLAIVTALRGTAAVEGEGSTTAGGWALVEVASFGGAPADTELVVEAVTPPLPGASGEKGESAILSAESLRLAPGESIRRRLPIPDAADIVFRLSGDALAVDDQALLPAVDEPPVRVRIDLASDLRRRAVERVLAATALAEVVEGEAELVIGDGTVDAGTATSSAASRAEEGAVPGSMIPWRLDWRVPAEGVAYLGPFLIDRQHPLTTDLDLGGVVWAADGSPPSLAEDERAVVRVGDRPLLVDRRLVDGGHHLTLRLDPRLSTLDRGADWPVLWWNLLSWRAAERPGVRPGAVRLGAPVRWVRDGGEGPARWIRPDGEVRDLAAGSERFELVAEPVGEHRLEDAGGSRRFAVNALAPAESDLRGSGAGRWGEWDDAASVEGETSTSPARERRPWTWAVALLAFALLVMHLLATSRPVGEGTA